MSTATSIKQEIEKLKEDCENVLSGREKQIAEFEIGQLETAYSEALAGEEREMLDALLPRISAVKKKFRI